MSVSDQIAMAIGRKQSDENIKQSEKITRTLFSISNAVNKTDNLYDLYKYDEPSDVEEQRKKLRVNLYTLGFIGLDNCVKNYVIIYYSFITEFYCSCTSGFKWSNIYYILRYCRIQTFCIQIEQSKHCPNLLRGGWRHT